MANGEGKGFSPQNGGDNTSLVWNEVDATHAGAGSITRPERGGVGIRNEFGDTGWATRNVFGQEPKVVEESVKGRGEPKAISAFFFVSESLLKHGEKPFSAWERDYH